MQRWPKVICLPFLVAAILLWAMLPIKTGEQQIVALLMMLAVGCLAGLAYLVVWCWGKRR